MSSNDKISALSFIDKDFPAIYTDVLDLAKKLSNEWDPSSSNESDPGVVLLKLASFIADHLNYNIDKNILENFLPSATQESSTRDLVEMNGYTPRYYNSATGDITFTYKPSTELANETTIPRFTLVVTSESGATYTQVEPLQVMTKRQSSSCAFIEGTKTDLMVNSSKSILLENIDDDNRLYFPSKYVAQNGVYVTSIDNGNEWLAVDYLNTRPLGDKVYKFDYDSSQQLPYLEFPSDIADIIGSGLNISYIKTRGADGNVAAGALTTIASPETYTDQQSSVTIETKYFKLTNASAILNGKNPETIDEMYRSFKKVVGTFETLVTRYDYTDYINNLYENNNKVVSNCVVTDSFNDFNRSTDILTLDAYGEHFAHLNKGTSLTFKSSVTTPVNGDAWLDGSTLKIHMNDTTYEMNKLSLAEFSRISTNMTPFDICVYAFLTYNFGNTTTSPIVGNAISYISMSGTSTLDKFEDLKTKIDEAKSINHNIIGPTVGDVVTIKNMVPIRATIMPYNKVTTAEASEIIENAINAVAAEYSLDNLEFGKELDYDSVLTTLLNADDRISDVRLEDFTYTPSVSYLTTSSGNVVMANKDLYSSTDKSVLKTIIAKNILAGRTVMFNVDDAYSASYGSQDRSTYTDVNKISSGLTITFPPDVAEPNTSKKGILANNENVNIIWPSYGESVVYPQYVKYVYTGATIPANTEHILETNESIRFMYYVNGASKDITYSGNEYNAIKPTFQLSQTTTETLITAGNSITYMEPMSTVLTNPGIYCTWNRNYANNTLFYTDTDNPDNSEKEYILGTGEFFAFTDQEFTSFVMFGPGTKLTRSDNNGTAWVLGNYIESDTINSNQDAWRQMNFSEIAGLGSFTIQEMNIVTLSSGYEFELHGTISGTSSSVLGNSWKGFSGSINYRANSTDSFSKLQTRTDYLVRSSLDINCDPNNPQQLTNRGSLQAETPSTVFNQSITVFNSTYPSGVALSNTYVLPSVSINITGDTILDADDITVSTFTGGADNAAKIDNTTIINAVNNEYNFSLQAPEGSTSHYATFLISCATDKDLLLPIYVKSGSCTIKVQDSADTTTPKTWANFNTSEYIFGTSAATHTVTGEKLFNLYVPKTSRDINLKLTITAATACSLSVLKPIIYDGANTSITKTTLAESDIVSEISSIITNSTDPSIRPRLKAETSGDISIQDDDFSDPITLFDVNNVISQFVVPAIDFENSSINIYKSMRLNK